MAPGMLEAPGMRLQLLLAATAAVIVLATEATALACACCDGGGDRVVVGAEHAVRSVVRSRSAAHADDSADRRGQGQEGAALTRRQGAAGIGDCDDRVERLGARCAVLSDDDEAGWWLGVSGGARALCAGRRRLRRGRSGVAKLRSAVLAEGRVARIRALAARADEDRLRL